MPIHTTDELTAAACIVANAIDKTAQADPDTLIASRHSLSHVVIITHRGQKFSVPIGTAMLTAKATAKDSAQPTNTAKKNATKPPSTTVKRSSSRLPDTTKKTVQ